MRRFLVKMIVNLIYIWGSIWYDKKYLTGQYFNRSHFSEGWKWILRYWFPQKVLGYARNVNFPVPRGIKICDANKIIFDNDDIINFHSFGCYYQTLGGKIYIGKNTKIAPNCGLITANHDLNDLNKHAKGADIRLGNDCWIGMNSVILPGIVLGNHTIVGAGSIVTKSFPEGNCVIAGNPAKKIRDL